MSFEVTVTPQVYNVEVEVNPSVQPFDVQVITQQDLADLVDEAKQYAEDAEDSADSASASASSASASASASASSANSASASASSASGSASTATTQAGIATTQAGIATTQAGIATTKAQEASQSASDALASEQASAQSASDALQSEQNALASEQASALSEANALASEQSASASASTATAQAGIATTQAGIATAAAASIVPVTIGTPANGLSIDSNQVLSIGLASGSTNGALSSTDWTTFNAKQNALTNPITGTGASGQVAFWTGTGTQTGDSGLTWDNANKRLSVGTASAFPWLNSQLEVRNQMRIFDPASSSFGLRFGFNSNIPFIQGFRETVGAINLQLQPSGGNVLINTTTDAGFRLDVNGTARVQGALTTNLTATRIPFIGTGGVLSDNSDFTWDNSTKRLIVQNTISGGTGYHAFIGGTLSFILVGTSTEVRLAGYGEIPLNFRTNDTLRWSILSTGVLLANGAQTIRTSTGDLTIATGGGNGNINLTPNGTGQVQVNGTPVVTGTGASGQVAFWSGTGTQSGSNNLFWDGSRLGIGTNTFATGSKLILSTGALVFRQDIVTEITSITTTGGQYISREIASRLNDTSDFGQLVVSAGGGTNTMQKSAIVINGRTTDGLTNGNNIRFFTQGVERVQINNTGQLWVNTTSGTNTIDVNGTGRIRNGVSLADTSGNVQIGTTTDAGFRLDVNGSTRFNGLSTIQGTTASDSGQLGSELLTTGTGDASWTGSSFATGYTHVAGSTTTLTSTLAGVVNNFYQITYTVTNRTAGSFTIAFGGFTSSSLTATGAVGPQATTTGTLVITPTSDFNGTIVLSIRVISTSSASVTFNNSSGTATNQIRISSINTNTFQGLNAGRNNTTGSNNTASGASALLNNTTGVNNTASGVNTLQNNTIGGSNTASGVSALQNNTIGINNTANGVLALQNNTTGINNTANGVLALQNNTTGGSNTANGASAGRFIANGSNLTIANNSVFVGTDTRANADNETNQIVIGHTAIGLGSNTTVIGNSSTTFGRWWGNLLIGTSTNQASSVLTMESTTRGFLPPRMTSTERNAIATPATGLVVYNTTDNRLSVYNGTAWVNLATV